MANAMTVPTTFNPAELAGALNQAAHEVPSADQFLRMEKTGEWIFGVDADTVAPGEDLFAVNPSGFEHGYIAWSEEDKGKLGEVMVPVGTPIPDPGPVPVGARAWQPQMGIRLSALNDGTSLLYRTTSVGGRRAIANLAGELATQIGELMTEGVDLNAPDAPIVAIVTLSSEWYRHTKYGKIFNPLITVTEWLSIAQVSDPHAALPVLEAEPEPKPRKGRKAA